MIDYYQYMSAYDYMDGLSRYEMLYLYNWLISTERYEYCDLCESIMVKNGVEVEVIDFDIIRIYWALSDDYSSLLCLLKSIGLVVSFKEEVSEKEELIFVE